MAKHEVSRQEGQAELVRMGERMYRVRTVVEVEEVEGEEGEQTNAVRQGADGAFEMLISGADAISIDRSERAIVLTSRSAMREALSHHLTSVSKKKGPGDG
jgi:hypothetical protein